MNYPADPDPQETREWVQSLQSLITHEGEARAEFILQQLFDIARRSCRGLKFNATTAYTNTIPLAEQPPYPGDLALEERITALVRWNALAMVVRANRDHPELGGHIATYASAADLFEVGLNHFFRAGPDGDLVYFQPHCSTGIYARAYLEGRLTEEQLMKYRQETRGGGLSSYPHPWLMPDFWQFPNASMGLGPINAIYQARFMRYLEDRGMSARPAADRKVWAIVGDGEMDEPESLAGLSLAARERLDNLIFVVNCNLQRLDGPVRGNGSIIQELEGLFTGAGWNVIKVLWGSDWDALFARDRDGILLKRLHETVDGELQKYAATDGRFNREHFFNKYPELQALVADLSDADIDRLRRGGHDPIKIYSAYHAATRTRGRPTVILAQTKKGYGMGHWGQGKMTAHQAKKLETDALLAFRDRFALPISDADVAALKFYKPAEDSHELKYLRARRKALGGAMPARSRGVAALPAPKLDLFARVLEGSHEREESTTMTFVALLSQLLKHNANNNFGKHVVPIVADEARTFGMQTLFRQFAIYSSAGQMYEPEDRDELLYYKEAKNGQILEEGITEAGAISSWIAAACAYSAHGVTMLPFYIFYSIFGFQRIADLIWAASDSRARGFLIGATSGRTTLSGEGLQHQDGSSHVMASTFPNCVSYDPTYGYELAVMIQDGMRRMLDEQEDVFYYLTVTNENYRMPAMPKDAEPGILRGMYLLKSGGKHKHRVQLMGCGTILREVLAAAEVLEAEYQIAADVWSVTSFTELARDGTACERWNRLHPEAPPRLTWIEQQLRDHAGPVVAATDYVRNYAEPIRAWIDRPYTVLGTDGFGRSDTRVNLRRFFEIDRAHIAVAALKALADQEAIPAATVAAAIGKFGIDVEATAPWLA
ncbi:MAG: pyruvate dehydrogenase (acetyl-transferring), homodimeric type [Betaproteobacteria bacterium]|nr:pyruvate dehydrogenase (acetyl-transferring), homodimeric type [Betaproteobacteria bacterium]